MIRKLTKDTNIFLIRDKIVKIYLKKILRKFKKLNQGSIFGWDEIDALTGVYTVYDEIVDISVEGLKEVAKKTYKWLCDEDMLVDMWLSGFLSVPSPVTHYKFFDEAERKKTRLYEAIMSCRTVAERKKQIEIGMRYWVRQFEQTADDVVIGVLNEALKNNDIKYVVWHTMEDAKVCAECARRNNKIYPITSPLLQTVHYNCRCWWSPV